MNLLQEILKDRQGKYSHARLISLIGAVAASVFIWKLIVLGGMTPEYFLLYLIYVSGQQLVNKHLDNKNE
jgi:hypothetical protein